MRAARLGLLLLFLAPMATAQDALEMKVSVDAFADPFPPLSAARMTPVHVEVPCAALSSDPTQASVSLWVASLPPWATASVSPSTFAVNPNACQNGRIALEGELAVTVNDQAPAFAPAPVEVAAAWDRATPNMTGMGSVDIEADYFSILDVTAPETIQTAPPDSLVVFPLTVANLGNARTRVTFRITEAGQGLEAEAPLPIVLQSKQEGGSAISAEVPVRVMTRDVRGYANEVGVVTVVITSAYVEDASRVGDDTTVSLLVTTKGFDTPAPSPLLVAFALAAAAGIAARTRRA